MADYNARIAPFIKETFYVTEEWWNPRAGYYHRGLDIATPTYLGNVPVYSIIEKGKVIQVWYNDPSMGNALVIKSKTNNLATLMMHFDSLVVRNGDDVEIGQLIGYEGTTGQSTGIHLHVEMKDMTGQDEWIWTDVKSDYLDPTAYMGFPNVEGISVYYDGEPYVPPTPIHKKKKFKWVLYARKNRERNIY